MKPKKIVYVKDYTRNLKDVVSDPADEYVEYPIYKLPMTLTSFGENEIQRWHPLIKIVDIDMKGIIRFKIRELEFEVENTEGKMLRVQTDFETKKYNIGVMFNNLNLFKSFQSSFILQDFVNSIRGHAGTTPQGVQFEIEDVFFTQKNSEHNIYLRSNILHIEVEYGNGLNELYMNYKEIPSGFEFIGISHSDYEVFYSLYDNINLDLEIQHLQKKRDIVEFIKFKLYDTFGIGTKLGFK